ncbi:MAG TPA: hypothetical protein VGG56_17235 [Terracidiphilus sp.]
MKIRLLSPILIATACCAVFAPALLAQNSVQVFGPVDTRVSEAAASYSNPVTFNTNNLNLTCPATPVGVLSSAPSATPLASTGNVLVDNNMTVTVSYSTANGTVTNGPIEVCPATGFPGPSTSFPNCFNTNGYEVPASAGSLTGQDPDTYVLPGGNGLTVDAAGGVAPINISSQLVSGAQSVTISLVDEGGYLTSSSLYLNTNCTQVGVTGPALVSGNTITQPPAPPQLTQTFDFNQTTNQVVGFVYDLSNAETNDTLTINSNGSTPQVADLPINPATFQANFAANTSFATSECLIHNGEVGGPAGEPATQPACKLFTLECTTGTGSSSAGANCPVSTVANEVVQDIFDGPNFTLNDIPTQNGNGPTFHEGIGFLMASEGWGAENGVPPGTWDWNGGTGGPCTFDPAADLNLPCPQNLLTSFTGPGTYKGGGETTHPNSTFISIAQVPEDLTTVQIQGASPSKWVNSDKVNVQFSSQPPNLQGTGLPGADAFIPSPIQSLTYGVSLASNLPSPIDEPIAGDVTLQNAACPIPTADNPNPVPAQTFTPKIQTLTFTADGQYLLHYYAQDCAGTRELKFLQSAGSWTTNFYTVPVNVDTVPPAITSLATGVGLPGNGFYALGAAVKASYACSDAGSGVVSCGGTVYASGTPNTGTLTTVLPTTSAGKHTFTVTAIDAAGNQTTASATYWVVGASAI